MRADRAAALMLLALAAGCGPVFLVAAGVGAGVGATLGGGGRSGGSGSAPPLPVFTWQSITPDPQGITAIAVDPNTPTTVYVCGEEGAIWVSLDGGTTWNTAATQPALDCWGVAVDNESIVYTFGFGLGEGEAFQSSDGGTAWEQVGLPGAQWIATDSTSDTVVAVTSGGVFLRAHAGVGWSPTANLPINGVQKVSILGTTIGVIDGAETGVAVSWDAGASWSVPDLPPVVVGTTLLTGIAAQVSEVLVATSSNGPCVYRIGKSVQPVLTFMRLPANTCTPHRNS
jgi:hypothetical protein